LKRRDFITLGLLLLTTPLYKNSPSGWDMISSTLEHLFPKSKHFSGAISLKVYDFLRTTSKDKYFDKNDLDFLIKGGNELYKQNKDFITSSQKTKEIILREFEQTQIGANWLSLVMNYGIEGMLSDPIYGGNKDEQGWIALKHKVGQPRPKGKYAL
jgi:gluconate 2-dehydrogenase gamma chain